MTFSSSVSRVFVKILSGSSMSPISSGDDSGSVCSCFRLIWVSRVYILRVVACQLLGLILRRSSSEVCLDVLLLEVAVGNVVVAPVRHRIELQAVGKLHLFCLAKLLELLPSLPIPLALTCALLCCICALIQLLELEALGALNVAVVAEVVQRGRRSCMQEERAHSKDRRHNTVRARLLNGVGSGGGAAFGAYLQAVLARGDWRD